MSDWREVRISELSTIDIGGTPSRAIPAFWAEKPAGHAWISIADLKGKYVFDTKEHITSLGVRSSNVKLIPEHTTVMSFKLTVGRTAITGREMFCNEAIAIFQPKDDRLNGQWLYHALPRAATSVVTDTAVKGATLNKAKMAEMTLNLPPPGEQIKIAQVLDTLDIAIHETEAIIAKLKAVKQGLLHDLLTRGIDANGELRPPQAEVPHLYKESPLGWIPKEWGTPLLQNVSTRVTDGTHQAVTTVADGGGEVPFLFVSCVRDGEIAWDKAATITKRDYWRISKGREPAAGMILYTAVGSYGHAAEVSGTREFAFQRHIACIYPDEKYVVAGFMPLVLNWEPMRGYADRVALGNAQKTITLGELSQYPFVCPKKVEQEEIVRRMRSAQEKLNGEVESLNKLRLQKFGLMDDLLTGRVRVTPLLAEAAQQQGSA